MYGANEDDPSTKLETSKEELEAGEAVVDAQFGNLLKTAFIIGNWALVSKYIYIYI